MEYSSFLEQKKIKPIISGFEAGEINPLLWDFEQAIVKWALKIGRACIFADCGLGKTAMQLEWAKKVQEHTGGNVLVVAPLAVTSQTVDEGVKFGIDVKLSRDGTICNNIVITNYEMLHKFDLSQFVGIVLDESSILKSFNGKTRTAIIESCNNIPYKLACTATPSPNDIMELGNHSEFVGSMSRTEMLSMFFVHDGGDTQKWRLKGHAKTEFWKWVCTWAINIRKPSDIGFSDDGFDLPTLNIHEIQVSTKEKPKGLLFSLGASTLRERQDARRASVLERCEKSAELANSFDTALIWCDRNDESSTLKKMVSGSIEIKGSDKPDYKSDNMLAFSKGKVSKLITKPSIAGFGMNWQHCNKVIFTGLSDSYEQYYQAVRRCYRFGQKKEVDVYIVISSDEGRVLDNIKRKDEQAKEMADMMVKCMSDISKKVINKTDEKEQYNSAKIKLPSFIKG